MTQEAAPSILSIVGAGSLGQAFAALLAASGQPVTLLATPASATRLASVGRIRLQGIVGLEVPVAPPPASVGSVEVADDPSALPEGAGLIFATKGHQLPRAIEAVHAAWPRTGDGAAWVAGVQNGILKDDLLARAFGPDRVVGAVTILGAQREPDGPITVTSRGMTYLGELDGRASTRVITAVERLRKAGIPAEVPADIRGALWSKACNAAGVFGVSVLTRMSAPGMFGNPHLIRAYLSLIRETAAIASACGVEVGDYVSFPIRTFLSLLNPLLNPLLNERPEAETVATLMIRFGGGPSAPTGLATMPSMTQDLLAGRPLEVEQVFGDLVERAERVGVAVPRLTLVRDLIRGLDSGHARPAPAPGRTVTADERTDG